MIRRFIFILSLPLCVAYDVVMVLLLFPPFLVFDIIAWSWGEHVDFARYRAAAADGGIARWVSRWKKVRK